MFPSISKGQNGIILLFLPLAYGILVLEAILYELYHVSTDRISVLRNLLHNTLSEWGHKMVAPLSYFFSKCYMNFMPYVSPSIHTPLESKGYWTFLGNIVLNARKTVPYTFSWIWKTIQDNQMEFCAWEPAEALEGMKRYWVVPEFQKQPKYTSRPLEELVHL